MAANATISENKRSWLSLWLVVHFFIVTVCLINNNGSSFLFRRIAQLTSPYSIATAQDLGAKPFEMTTGSQRSMPHALQYRLRKPAPDADDQRWETFEPKQNAATRWIDHRWANFQHMLAVAAHEKNEELIYIVFDQVAAQLLAQQRDVETLRLLRPAKLSYEQNELYRDGKLPATELQDQVLYEARVVRLPGDAIKLLPVLEQTRRATSLEVSP